MKRTRLIGGAAALALTLAACGNNEPAPPVAQAAADGEQVAAAPAPATATPATLLGNTELGNMLVGPDGRSLYGFTNDTQAASTCYGGCAEAWPPVLVDENWTVGPGLDLGIFATTVRDDGRLQLVAGKWPLYFYAGDGAPGDINGQGSGDVWFAVDTTGILITDGAAATAADDTTADDSTADENGGDSTADAAAPVTTATIDLGSVLVDEAGLTLYGFTEDVDGVPSCEGPCAEAWPPLLVDELPPGLDPTVFSLATRPDGTTQLVAGVWPLYRFAGDAAPGDSNGQGSGGVWFAAAPDGSLLKADSAQTASSDGGSDQDSGEGSSDGY